MLRPFALLGASPAIVRNSEVLNRIANLSFALARKTVLILVASFFVGANSTAETSFDLAQYRGRVLVLDFWASWCVACRRSFPWMNEMQEKYAEQGLVIVAVNMDAEPELTQAFLQEYPAHFEVIEDGESELARKFDVIAMPSSYVIDRNGHVLHRHLGFKVNRQGEDENTFRDVLPGTGEESDEDIQKDYSFAAADGFCH